MTTETMMLVEYMPRQSRASHEAAGNSGRYPLNGADRFICSASDAEWLVENEGAEILRPATERDADTYDTYATLEDFSF